MGFTFALLSMFFAGIGNLLLKEATDKLGPAATTLFYYGFGLLFSIVLSVSFAHPTITKVGVGWAAAAALSLSLAFFFFSASMKYINVSISSTIFSLCFVVTIAGAMILRRESLSWSDFAATAMAVGAVVIYGLKSA